MPFYPVGPDDRVIELRDLPAPDPGATEPRLDATDRRTILEYSAAREGGRVTVTFDRCLLLQLGWPNDEVWHTHPLASRGLGPYGIYEVRPSGWIAAVAKANSAHPSHSIGWAVRLRHLIFMMHDDTFECIVEGYRHTVAEAI